MATRFNYCYLEHISKIGLLGVDYHNSEKKEIFYMSDSAGKNPVPAPFIDANTAKMQAYEYVLNTYYPRGGYADTNPSAPKLAAPKWNDSENRWEVEILGYLGQDAFVYLVYLERADSGTHHPTVEITTAKKTRV